MYTNLDLYYLNLMGISPWLDKKNCLANDTGNRYKLLILTSSDLTPKEQTLLQQIISFVDLDRKYLKHLESEKDKKPAADPALNADYILAFGKSSNYKLSSVIETESLNELVNNPILKKKLFNLLVSLKSKLVD